ncbi:ubiquinol oxidase subunit II [Desulfomonile tiedjei]|uniref:Ubiquinol oxidase polypeptide II n=1 Tax=Desulfomonile tiedjei (strain ATCC 49306 / DSM 6799 / DCB-1) TaxID=706587 RepID=I4C4Z3_DESTA|nr:ubiquinol oxidase subunit II [Desulfomonile tiedjei]AFM24634.1 cytochrome bo3 quinol oxidase subunit 2 [Desulfomonile tiedjei DSM 6799]
MKKKFSVFAGLLSLCSSPFLGGCSSILLLNPKGPIGEAERFVIIAAIVLMLIVVIPVFIMAIWFPRKYRASNTESTYMPKWSHSGKIEFFMWGGPVVIVTLLAILAWNSTHSLDPYRPIPSADKPINIEAVCLDWKWLFIYPDHDIAIVNEITFPVNVPLSFKITSDTVMASFFIPQLGSQIYAMAGMQTRLHLLADKPGAYAGHNQQFTGRGYPNMHFKAHAVSREEFESWVQKIRQSPEKLDLDRYEKLAKPSDGYHPVTYFSSVNRNLFEHILRKYHPTPDKNHGPMTGGSVSPHARTDVLEEN